MIGTNIRYLRKMKGLTQDQLADKIGVNRAMIGSYEEERAIPKLPAIQALAHYFGLSIDHLLNTDLSTINQSFDVSDPDMGGKSLRVVSTIVDRNNNEMITVVPIKASAGYLNGYADPDYIENLPRFTLPLPELSKDRTYRAFQIRGDSMEPIPSGAYVISEYLVNWKELNDGKTYILVTRDEGVVFKRVSLHPSGEIWLRSDNPQYEPYTIHLSRVLEIWKAVGYICTAIPEPDTVSLSKLSNMVMEMKLELDKIKKNNIQGPSSF
jgi:transcriptional regulator with XRE-family HTH domain